MKAKAVALLVALLAVGIAVGPATAVTASSPADAVTDLGSPDGAAVADDGNAADGSDAAGNGSDAASNHSVMPGERLSGVVGVQGAEIEGEIAERRYDVRIAKAKTDEARASVVAEQLSDVERRLARLEERKARLAAARENGSISRGRYSAEVAELVAEIGTARRLANASGRTAESLPADLLSAKGVDVEAIRTLKSEAETLSGPEVSEVARSIAGDDVGRSIAEERRPGGDRGPGAGNRSDADNGSDAGNGPDVDPGPGAGDGDAVGNGTGATGDADSRPNDE